MTLTLDEVRKTKFHMARRTGYEVSEVDLFVDRVEASFAQLAEENQMLKQQVETLKQSQTRQPLQDQKPAEAKSQAAPAKAADIPTTKVPTVSGAGSQKLIVSTAAEASPAVIRLVQLATEQSDQLVNEAADDAKRKLDEANRKAEQITRDANKSAERTTSEARSRAEDLDRQTGLRRTELFASLEQERDQLQQAVGKLRGFEARYRETFITHLKDQLQVVETVDIEPTSRPELADPNGGSDDNNAQSSQAGQGSTPRLDALLSDSQRKG